MNFGLLPPCNLDQYKEVWKQRHKFLPAVKKICQLHNVNSGQFRIFETGSNFVIQVNENIIVKIYFPFLRNQFDAESAVLNAIEGRLKIKTPKLQFSGELDSWPYIGMSIVNGTSLSKVWPTLNHSNRILIMKDLGKLISAFHEIPIEQLTKKLSSDWHKFLNSQILGCIDRHLKTNLPANLLLGLPSYLPRSVTEIWDEKRLTLISGDFTPEHILLNETNGHWSISGLIDFADSMVGQPEYDFSGPATFITVGETGLLKEMLISYGYTDSDLDGAFSKRMMQLTLLHRFANFREQLKIINWESQFDKIEDLEKYLWYFYESKS